MWHAFFLDISSIISAGGALRRPDKGRRQLAFDRMDVVASRIEAK